MKAIRLMWPGGYVGCGMGSILTVILALSAGREPFMALVHGLAAFVGGVAILWLLSMLLIRAAK